MTLKNAALLALIGTILMTALPVWTFVSTFLNVLRDLIPAVTLFSSLINALGCFSVAMFFAPFIERSRDFSKGSFATDDSGLSDPQGADLGRIWVPGGARGGSGVSQTREAFWATLHYPSERCSLLRVGFSFPCRVPRDGHPLSLLRCPPSLGVIVMTLTDCMRRRSRLDGSPLD